MCGIVGYVGPREVRPLLLLGLEHLEYRGYDSAGISVLSGPRIEAVRAVGNLRALRDAIERSDRESGGGVAVGEREPDDPQAAQTAGSEQPAQNNGSSQTAESNGAETRPHTGIGHTRWATHGRVSEANAHPHFDTGDRIHIVVNGIVENYVELKRRLSDMGAVFTSETDAEVIAHLIAYHGARGSLVEAVRAAYAELRGHYAFVAMSADEPGVLVGARRECPLVVGRGEGEQFIASAIPGFLGQTRRV